MTETSDEDGATPVHFAAGMHALMYSRISACDMTCD